MIAVSGLKFGITLAFAAVPRLTMGMRIPRPWSEDSACERAVDPDWPFVYSKYRGQEVYENVCIIRYGVVSSVV